MLNISTSLRMAVAIFFTVLLAACQEGSPNPSENPGVKASSIWPKVGVSSTSVEEGEEGITELSFTIYLDTTSGENINVDYETVDGTANAGVDYNAAAGTATIPKGSNSVEVRIGILGDYEVEDDESLKLALSNPENAVINNAQAIGIIVNDDTDSNKNNFPSSVPLPRISIEPASVAERDSGTGNLVFTITLDRAAETEVSVEFATADGTAVAGSDYQATSGRLTIPQGAISGTVAVVVLGDSDVEDDETFRLRLSDPVNAGLRTAEATGTIRNDDAAPLPQIRINAASVEEGNSGVRNLDFSVTLDRAADQEVSVRFATADGTARAGSDYRASSGTLTIPRGETSRTVRVEIVGDTDVEDDETFRLRLSDPVNAGLRTAEATGTIRNDDAAPLPQIRINAASVEEGNSGVRNLDFSVTLDRAADQEVSVRFATADGTARAGSDYRASSGTLTIPRGETSRTVRVEIVGDTDVEDDETFRLRLSNPVNAGLRTAEAIGTIRNDDNTARLPRVSISPVSINEGDSGSRNLVFTVSLDSAHDKQISVDYATADDTATAGSDYQATSGKLTIPGGATSATIQVPVTGDTEVESNEIFSVVLSNPLDAILENAEAIGTILNDDVSVATGSCTHTGSGNDYPVGPGQSYVSISDVPWNELGPGDTVRIHYRSEPYREKIIISTNGTVQNPIRLCGVAGPNGERPILDGDGAVNDPDDRDAYSTYRPMEGLAMVMLYNRDYDQKVHNVVIEGLHIRNAKNTFSYFRTDGTKVKYEGGAACIRIQAADNVVIRNNELENCSNGIFTMSQGYNEASLTRNLLIEGNYLHGHSQEGSYYEHGLYIQAIGVIYQYNRFGANAPGSGGTTLKERAAGSIIRYNWFDSGSARFLDLVEVEDAAAWYIVDEYLRELGCSDVNNCSGIDPVRLAKVRAADAVYRKTYVYGNFFNHVGSQTDSGNIVHYGSDNDPSLSRAGTLYFYNNTVSIQEDLSDSWRFRLFYLGNRNASSPSKEVVEAFNNIVYFTGETGAPANFCLGENNKGTINFGRNWITDTWDDPEAIRECYSGGASAAPTLNGVENLLNTAGAPPPINQNTLESLNTPLVQETGQSIPAEYPVTMRYVRHQKSASRGSVNDMGAMEVP